MRKRIGLALAMVLVFLGAASSPSPAVPAGIDIRNEAVVRNCPNMPSGCCVVGWSGFCRVCLRTGC
jgi:hypothetical protein